jgi:hypothetical protein
MKVLSLALLRTGASVEKPVYLCHEVDVSDFGYFTRGGCVERCCAARALAATLGAALARNRSLLAALAPPRLLLSRAAARARC